MGWIFLINPTIAVPLFLFAAIKLHLNNPTSSPARVQGVVLMGLGMTGMLPFRAYAYPFFDPINPASASPTAALLAGIGWFMVATGAAKYLLEHLVASAFQMVYSLEQAKAKQWTRRFRLLSLLVFGFFSGAGLCIVFIGCHFAHNEAEDGVVLKAGFIFYAIGVLVIAAVFSMGFLELRALRKAISPASNTGKALELLVPLFAMFAAATRLQRQRMLAWACLSACLCHGCTNGHGPCWGVSLEQAASSFRHWAYIYEMQQLHKPQAQGHAEVQKQQRQITPLRSSSSDLTANTSTIADTAAATKQVRRKASASLVLNSGVSLAFLELFIREHSIDASMTANDVVNRHVKPHTEVIGFEGSGAPSWN
jgi:hypothetical protein